MLLKSSSVSARVVLGIAARAQPKGKRDLKERRTSTSNWIEDRVTWKEEKLYKQAMGYLK